MTVRAFAPAKVNLTLHVTGRRSDGFHLLDSIVVFAGLGDVVAAAPSGTLSLAVRGPEAEGVPTGRGNLVIRAAEAVGARVRLRLDKSLPAAAGIGGGSSDAAATLRALARLGFPAPADAATLGADVPVCLGGTPARMRGVGDILQPLPPLPPVWLVLVNPRVSVETRGVFAALDRRDASPMPRDLPRWSDAAALAAWLAEHRNDLQPPAQRLVPPVRDVLAALEAAEGCLLARMSGSGATCFGLFADAAAAGSAVRLMQRDRPRWWVAAAPVLRDPPWVEEVPARAADPVS